MQRPPGWCATMMMLINIAVFKAKRFIFYIEDTDLD